MKAKKKRPGAPPRVGTRRASTRLRRSAPPSAPPGRGGRRVGAGRRRSSAPVDLVSRLEGAKDGDDLLAALQALAIAGARGDADKATSKLCLELARETRQVITKLKAKEAPAGVLVGAVDVLTPDERALVDAYRKGKAKPPLRPGEATAPPDAPPGVEPRIAGGGLPNGKP